MLEEFRANARHPKNEANDLFLSHHLMRKSAQSRLGSREKAFLVVFVSFCVWSGWELLRPMSHPFGDLSDGNYTDHISHMNSARVFPHIGFAIWRRPINQIFPEASGEDYLRLPDDVKVGASKTGGIYTVPGWRKDKPLAINWSNRPRNYPPGDLVLFAPVALLYHYTALPAKWTNRLAIVCCILFAHIAFYIFILFNFVEQTKETPPPTLFFILFYSTSLNWALEGFYDCAATVPIFICGGCLARKRGVDALLAYCVGAFIHYRTFFLAPLVVCAAFIILRERQWLTWRRSEWIKAILSFLFAFAALFPFLSLWPWISSASTYNPINFWGGNLDMATLIAFLIVLGSVGAFYSISAAWFDVFCVFWFVIMFTNVREVYKWHMLIPMAWAGLPVRIPGQQNVANVIAIRDLRLFVILYLTVVIYQSTLLPQWLDMVVRLS
jgi:hypothetical protein